MPLSKINNKIICLGVFVLFLILSLLFTKAPIIHLGHLAPQGPDPLLVSWIWSWEMHQIPTNPLELFNTNIFTPYKNTLAFTEHMLGSLLLAWPLFLIFKNIILVFNLICLSSFAIGGLGMYLLAYYLTKNKSASFVAAFIYAFAPFKIIHQEHINLTGMWLPYFFLYLHKIFQHLSWKNILLLLAFTLMVFLNAMQYFLFLPIVAVCFFIAHVNLQKIKVTRAHILKILVFFLALFLVCLPIIWPYLQLKNDNFIRAVDSIEGLSPDLMDYLISPFFYKYFYSAYLSEWLVGPGIFVLFLLIFSIIIILRYRSFEKEKARAVYFVIGFIAIFISFGYYIQFTRGDAGGLFGPWAFLYHFIPGFSGIRCVGRYSTFFLLSASVIVALGLADFLAHRFKNNPQKNIVILLLIILLLAWEFSFVPTKDYVPALATPKVYDWAKNQPNENIYIIMPFGYNYLKNHWDAIYEYWSIAHFKKIVNGYSGYRPPKLEELNKILHDPNLNQEQLATIKQSGATHIIFHFDFYPSGFDKRIAALLSDEQFAKLVYQVNNDYVYQLK